MVQDGALPISKPMQAEWAVSSGRAGPRIQVFPGSGVIGDTSGETEALSRIPRSGVRQ